MAAFVDYTEYNNYLLNLRSQDLPRLLELPADPKLDRIRTHTSYHQKPHQDFEEPTNFTDDDYERMEFLGDQVVGLAAAELISEKYAFLTVGTMTVLKSRLVANTTLCELSRCYGLHLPHRFRAHPYQKVVLAQNGIVRAALFEAYAAALKEQHGLAKTLAWIKNVFVPLARKAYDIMKESIVLSQLKNLSTSSGKGSGEASFVSYVSKLEEWRMRGGRGRRVVYEKKETYGPPHRPIHRGIITVEGKLLAKAEGPVWQDVRHELARSALVYLGALPS